MRQLEEEREKEGERMVLLNRKTKAYKQEEIADNEMLNRQYVVQFVDYAFYKKKFV